MILYFTDRAMDILGTASTGLEDGFAVKDDLKSEDVDTGVASFSCYICYDQDGRSTVEEMLEAGNYLLRSNGNEHEFYTIIDTDMDTKKQEVYVYAEDAGLDLLNTIAMPIEFSQPHPISFYINKWAASNGFEIGINEIPSYTRTLKWEGESTVTERLASVANSFGAEISYSYEIKGLTVVHKYINIFRERGQDISAELRMNRSVDNIRIHKSVENLATALYATGGIPKGKQKPITLSGYEYDDGDFYVRGVYLHSRKALKKWSRYVAPSETGTDSGHLQKTFNYNTTSQRTLCSKALAKLKKICDTEINYEADVLVWPDNVGIGDRVNIIDDEGELYISTRILKLETSIVNDTRKAVFGEYIIRDSGIHEKVEELAAKFAESEKDRPFYTWIVYADDESGTGISLDPAGKNFMGISANNVTDEPDLTDPAIYKWSSVEGNSGEDGTVLRINSSRGSVFKNSAVSTVLNVVIYRGNKKIENMAELKAEFGISARLEWKWQRLNEDRFGIISASDSKLSREGFSLTLTPADVDSKVTFECNLIID